MTRHAPSSYYPKIILLMFSLLLVGGLTLPQRAEAGWLSKLAGVGERTTKDGKGTAARAGARRMTRAEAIALAGTVSGGVIYADMMGGKLILHAIKDGVEAAVDLGDNFADNLKAELRRIGTAGVHHPIALSDDTARALGDRLDGVTAHAEVKIVRQSLPPMPLLRVAQPGPQIRHFVQISPGLVYPLETGLTDAGVAVLSNLVRRDAIRIVPLFSRSDMGPFTRLAEATGDRIADMAELISNPSRWPGSLKDQLVVIVGHIERDAFVVRDAASTAERRIPIAEINRLAQVSEANLVLTIGCSSFSAGGTTGLLHPVTDVQVARSLREALQARSNADFLGRLGTPENPFVVTDQALDQIAGYEALRLERLLRHEDLAQGSATSVRVVSLLGTRAASGLPEVLMGYLIFGAGGVVFMFQANRAAFLEHFPVLPNQRLYPVRYLGSLMGREAAFWTLCVPVSAVTVLVILLGGWRYREAVFRGLWSGVMKPLRALEATGLAILFLSASYLPGILVFCFTLTLLSVAWEKLSGAGAAMAGLATILLGGYIALLTFKRMPRLVEARLMAFAGQHPHAVLICGTTISLAVIAGVLAIVLNQ